jgi:ribose 1,5-bisphosphokinase PhnN
MAIIGVVSVLGESKTRSDFKTIYSQSAGDASLADRTRQMMKDIRQGYGTLLLFAITAALLILISVLIGRFG